MFCSSNIPIRLRDKKENNSIIVLPGGSEKSAAGQWRPHLPT
eukprot:NP_494988.1 Uncharacterized protein CELE_C54A12.3 [Caenorhabditis elegans]